MTIRLEVRSQEAKWVKSPATFHSTDEECNISVIKDFCRRHNIPYSDDFVSVWAMPADSSQVKQLGNGRTAWMHRNADSYGKEIIILGEHVVSDLALVACGDFYKTILEAVDLEKTGKDVKPYLDDMIFILPQDMPRDERIALLEIASRKARSKIKHGDAETRIFRPLRNSDKA